ncbi:MAG: CDP-glycerol glycerophosphotransferase family protein [Paludibacteraceae bacterium]|nr:CDP-glycerol glycerophosphotransferase family protein [Paludibacteraceae bacterium]MBR1481271.1 CDP-glycerol glycerophosphotransferase family protein [Paludibacteraceae bacterium]
MKHYLLFASHSYAFAILRPIQAEIRRRGDEAAWWLEYSCPDMRVEGETRLYTLSEVRAFAPLAVIAPGNWVYPFFPGIKVEVFHGYPMRKRIEQIDDHFTLRGWWDIYCTQGPSSTPYFTRLAQQHGYFRIYETGWCKADTFFTPTAAAETPRQRPCILYAPTFSKGISSVWEMPPVIDRLAATEDWDWLITFHPLLLDDRELVARYEQLAQRHSNVHFIRVNRGVETFRRTDALLCDSSSLIVEYLMMRKPVVTLRNTHPGPYLIDVQTTDEIGPALHRALTRPDTLMSEIDTYTAYHEAHRDGHNAARVLDAIDDFDSRYRGRLPRKPLNLWRKMQMIIRYLKSRR